MTSKEILFMARKYASLREVYDLICSEDSYRPLDTFQTSETCKQVRKAVGDGAIGTVTLGGVPTLVIIGEPLKIAPIDVVLSEATREQALDALTVMLDGCKVLMVKKETPDVVACMLAWMIGAAVQVLDGKSIEDALDIDPVTMQQKMRDHAEALRLRAKLKGGSE